MVQILPYVQSPLEQLTPHIAQAATHVTEGFKKQRENRLIQANEKILNDPNSSVIQKNAAFSKMPLDYKKSSAPVWAATIGPQAEFEAYNRYTQNQGGDQKQNIPEAAPLEFEGYKFEPEDASLLTPPKSTPAVGPLAAQAKIEATQRNREEDRTNEFLKKFPDLQKSESDLNKLHEAKKIIETLPDNIMQKLVQAKLEDKRMDAIAEVFKNAGQQKLFHLMRPYLETKEIGGSNPSTKEVMLALASLPSGLKTKEANAYIIDSMIADKQNQNKLLKFYNYASSKNPYISPADLQRLGSKITSPQPLEKVQMGTPLTNEKAREFVLQYGSVDAAKKAARDAGYEFP